LKLPRPNGTIHGAPVIEHAPAAAGVEAAEATSVIRQAERSIVLSLTVPDD